MKSAWENAHPGFTLTPENKTIKKSVQQDTTEQVYLYYFSSAIPSNNSLMTVQHTFIGKGGASFPVNGQMVSSTIKMEYKMGTTGSKCTPDYHELASALEEAGYTVTKPDKIEATYGTNAKVTYNYEVAPPSSQPQEPKITYTVKHMYAKTISVNATTNPDDFYEYDGTYGGKTIEEGYTN